MKGEDTGPLRGNYTDKRSTHCAKDQDKHSNPGSSYYEETVLTTKRHAATVYQVLPGSGGTQ